MNDVAPGHQPLSETAPWRGLVAAAPELAEFGARLLTAAPAYLGTVRKSGAPRVHPVTPVITTSGLFVFMEPTSPKRHDLIVRRLYTLHNGVPDNAGTGGEFVVNGQGRLVEDPATWAEVADAASYEPAPRYVLFELELSEARSNVYGDVDPPDPTRWVFGVR